MTKRVSFLHAYVSLSELQRDRHRETKKQGDRATLKQRDRDTERPTGREAVRRWDRDTGTQEASDGVGEWVRRGARTGTHISLRRVPHILIVPQREQ